VIDLDRAGNCGKSREKAWLVIVDFTGKIQFFFVFQDSVRQARRERHLFK